MATTARACASNLSADLFIGLRSPGFGPYSQTISANIVSQNATHAPRTAVIADLDPEPLPGFDVWGTRSIVRQSVNPVPKTPISKAPAPLPANDNQIPANQEVVDFLRVLIPQDDAAADALCRRGERMANAVVIVMATCLVGFPLFFAGLIYAGVGVVP